MPALFLNRIMKLTIKIVICYFTTHEHLRPIAIGNPLKLSPDFPPLHTVHATFTAHGAPSNSAVQGF